MNKSTRHYRTFDPEKGYPVGKDLFYECLECGDVVPSQPDDDKSCKCRNVMVDISYGRISIDNHEKVRLFSV